MTNCLGQAYCPLSYSAELDYSLCNTGYCQSAINALVLRLNEIEQKQLEASRLKLKGIYKHFKGNYYILEDIAHDSETHTVYVVYRQLYGDNSVWIRPVSEFLSEVDHGKYPEISQKYRFELITNEETKNDK